MSNAQTFWVLGHKVRLIDTEDSYGMIEVVSPPLVPGPPPHYHKAEHEFFLVIHGTLDVMSNGSWQRLSPGGFADLPPGTAHTFINNSEEDVVWVTGWRPKGFQQFFHDFGVPAHEPGAQEASLADERVQEVVRNVERYGMYLSE